MSSTSSYHTSCNTDPRKCAAQVSLYQLLKDPVINNLVSGGEIAPESYDAKKYGGLGWMPMRTNSYNGIEETSENLNSKGDLINFLILKKYTDVDSKLIFKGLGGRAGTTETLVKGQNIIFDNNGHISVKDGNTGKVIYNPIIPAGDNRPPPASLDITVANNSAKTLDRVSTSYGWDDNKFTYMITTKMTLNPNLRYILYTPDNVPSISSKYYLLYNPIHREAFRDYYIALLKYDATEFGPGGKLYNPGANRGYQTTEIDAVPTTSGGVLKRAPSFKTVMAKYCNAIKLGGTIMDQNLKEGEHYADPVCNLALSETDAKLSFILGKNRTQESLGYKFWAFEGENLAKGKERYQAAMSTFEKLPESTRLAWPCDNQRSTTTQDSYNWIRKHDNLWGSNSTSFINVLANAFVNFDETLVNKPGNPLAASSPGPTCPRGPTQITTCVAQVNTGIANNNNIDMDLACGAQSPSQTGSGTTTNRDGDGNANEDGDGVDLQAVLAAINASQTPKEKSNTMLYLGLGGAFLVLLIMIILLL